MTPHFLAFDVGTSGVKVVVVDANGCLKDSTYRAYGLLMVGDAGVEQDLALIIASTLEAARELVDRVGTTVAIAGITGTLNVTGTQDINAASATAFNVAGREFTTPSWLPPES